MPTSSFYNITNDQQNDFVVVGLDTTAMVGEEWKILDSGATIDAPSFHVEKKRFDELVERQTDVAFEELKNSSANWKIAFGHHPFVSNGSHGAAGRYDVSLDGKGNCMGNCCLVNSADPVPGRYAVDQPDSLEKPGDDKHDEGGGWHCGWRLRQFFVGGAQRRFTEGPNPIPGLCEAGLDVYFSGHDHLLQVSVAQCSKDRTIPFIVSGGGGADNATYTPQAKPSDPQSWIARAWLRHGFVYVEIDGLHMNLTVVGANESASVNDELQHCDVAKMGRDMPPTIKCDRPRAKPIWEQCDQVTKECLVSP
jgi:hypothetical protein